MTFPSQLGDRARWSPGTDVPQGQGRRGLGQGPVPGGPGHRSPSVPCTITVWQMASRRQNSCTTFSFLSSMAPMNLRLRKGSFPSAYLVQKLELSWGQDRPRLGMSLPGPRRPVLRGGQHSPYAAPSRRPSLGKDPASGSAPQDGSGSQGPCPPTSGFLGPPGQTRPGPDAPGNRGPRPRLCLLHKGGKHGAMSPGGPQKGGQSQPQGVWAHRAQLPTLHLACGVPENVDLAAGLKNWVISQKPPPPPRSVSCSPRPWLRARHVSAPHPGDGPLRPAISRLGLRPAPALAHCPGRHHCLPVARELRRGFAFLMGWGKPKEDDSLGTRGNAVKFTAGVCRQGPPTDRREQSTTLPLRHAAGLRISDVRIRGLWKAKERYSAREARGAARCGWSCVTTETVQPGNHERGPAASAGTAGGRPTLALDAACGCGSVALIWRERWGWG